MSLYIQQNTIEDQILSNYVYLRDVILGDKRLCVNKRIKKELALKSCKMCGIEFKPRSYGAVCCGDRSKKVGCAYKMSVLAGVKAGRITQLKNKYNRLKQIWEQED